MCHGINGVSTALVKCVVLVNNRFPAFSWILSVRPFPWRCRLQGCLWCLRMSAGLGWAGLEKSLIVWTRFATNT